EAPARAAGAVPPSIRDPSRGDRSRRGGAASPLPAWAFRARRGRTAERHRANACGGDPVPRRQHDAGAGNLLSPGGALQPRGRSFHREPRGHDRAQRRDRGDALFHRGRLRAPGPLAAGLAIVGLPQLAYFAAHGAFSDLVRDTILATLTEQRTYYHHPIPDVLAGIPPEPETGGFLFRYLPPSIHNYVMENGTLLGWKPTRSFYRVVIVLSYYVPIAILAGGAFLALLGRDAPRVRRSARTVAAFAALLFLALFPNTGWAHLLFVLPLVLVLAAWLLFHVGSRLRGCVLLGVALLAGMT